METNVGFPAGNQMFNITKSSVGDPLMPKEWPKRARIGINGFGKLARTLLRCALRDTRGLDIVAINEPKLTPEQMIYLFKYDSNLGPFKGYVSEQIVVTPAREDENQEYCNMEIAGRLIGVFRCENIENIPWNWLNVEYVLETTGKVKHLKEATKHLLGGRARKVLVVDDPVDIPLLMYPISCRGYQRGTSVMASGSPMAHAVSTLVSIAEETCHLEHCMATIVCSIEGDQNLLDQTSKRPLDWRRGRAAMQNIIPGTCPATVDSVIQALPSLRNRIDAITMTVPTFEGALVDLVLSTKEPIDGISEILEKLTKSPLLETYNELHVQTQPFNNRPFCVTEPPVMTSPSSLASVVQDESDESVSIASGPSVATKADLVPVITMPNDLTSIVVPLAKDEAYVSSDAIGKHSMCLLSVDCCILVGTGRMVKLVSWFDTDVSFCERILDTVVYMRSIDHT